MRAVYNTPHEAFCIALFLTYSWICEVHRSSKPSSSIVKTKAYKNALYHMYVCPTSAHRGFRYGYRRHKGNNFISESVLFCWQNLILWHDLTLLNINMSKKSTFAWFFLAKRFVLSNDYSYFCTVSSHQASQRCSNAWGFFCIYTLLSNYANGKIIALH